MPTRSDLLLSDTSDVSDLALDADQGTDSIIRVVSRQTAAAEQADLERLLDAGAVRTSITSDPAISSTELQARLAAVGLVLEVDRLVSTLYVTPAPRVSFAFVPIAVAD
jgi:hypothetical protein